MGDISIDFQWDVLACNLLECLCERKLKPVTFLQRRGKVSKQVDNKEDSE